MWQITISRHQTDPTTTTLVDAMTVRVSERNQLLGIEDALAQAFECHNWAEPRDLGFRLEVHAHRYAELLASEDEHHHDENYEDSYEDDDEDYDEDDYEEVF